jgi:YD repeat-containing protein
MIMIAILNKRTKPPIHAAAFAILLLMTIVLVCVFLNELLQNDKYSFSGDQYPANLTTSLLNHDIHSAEKDSTVLLDTFTISRHKSKPAKNKGTGIGENSNTRTNNSFPLTYYKQLADSTIIEPGFVNVTDYTKQISVNNLKKDKPPVIAIPFDQTKIPENYMVGDIHPFAYSRATKKWHQLKKDSVDLSNDLVYTTSDLLAEETDFINGIIKSPESPETFGYTPTTMKDIKLADPASMVQTIEPPAANNQGSAKLSYHIETPKGRNGIEPDLNITYNSDGGTGWLGEGWNLSISKITVESRWAPAPFNSKFETETYLLDGQMLAFIHDDTARTAHRHLGIPRKTGTVQFYTRKYSSVKIIERIGDDPEEYTWVITDRGIKYYYGGTGKKNSPAVLRNGTKEITQWMLYKVEDLYGNYMFYNYQVVDEPFINNVNGRNIYLEEIEYSGNDSVKNGRGRIDPHSPNYIVEFIRKTGKRQDITTTGRSGYIIAETQLLDSIKIYLSYKTPATFQLVRGYHFEITNGSFNKTLLKEIHETGSNKSFFYKHVFSYYNEDPIQKGDYFGKEVTWRTSKKGISAGLKDPLGIASLNEKTILGASKSSSTGSSFYIGLGPAGNPSLKDLTAGFQGGGSTARSEGLSTLVDMNGDGLPDRVYRDGGGIFYQQNTVSGFDSEPIRITTTEGNLSQFSLETSRTNTNSKQLVFGRGSIGFDDAKTESVTTSYFTDVNGDGLIDIYTDGKVFFNLGAKEKIHTFSRFSSRSPVPINSEEAANPMQEAVRFWEAPFSGRVQIKGAIKLIDNRNSPDFDPAKFDGIRATIDTNGKTLDLVTLKDDYTPQTFKNLPASIEVKAGRKIYFRLQSGTVAKTNGSFDQVEWDPEITYTGYKPSGNITDVFDRNEYQYIASDDYLLSSEGFRLDSSLKEIDITWNFKKSETHDSVRVEFLQLMPVRVAKNDIRYFVEKKLISETYKRTDTTVSKKFPGVPVHTKEGRIFRYVVSSDVNISLKDIVFEPFLTYKITDTLTCEHEGELVNCLADTTRERIQTLFGLPQYEFLSDLQNKGEQFSFKDTSDYLFTASLNFRDTVREAGIAFFTIRDSVSILKKIEVPYEAGRIFADAIDIPVKIDSGQLIYCTYEIQDTAINDKIRSSNFEITKDKRNATVSISTAVPPVQREGQSYKITRSGLYSLRPYIKLQNNTSRGRIDVQVIKLFPLPQGVNSLVLHQDIIRYGHDTIFYPGRFELNLTANDVVIVKFSTNDAVLQHTLKVAEYRINDIKRADLWLKRKDEKFGPMYRGWGQFVYSGMEGRAVKPILDKDLEITYPTPGLRNEINTQSANFQGMSQGQLEQSQVPVFNGLQNYSPLKAVFMQMGAFIDSTGTIKHWMGMADDIFITPSISSTSRLGIDDVILINPFETNPVIHNDRSFGYAIPRISKSRNRTFNAGYTPVSLNKSDNVGPSEVVSDFMDINGDRYPDIISKTQIKYTLPTGKLGATEGNDLVQSSSNGSIGLGVSAGFFHKEATFTLRSGNNRSSGRSLVNLSDGQTASVNAAVNIGASASFNDGNEETQTSWADINGDGLPDKLKKNAAALNLGNNIFTGYINFGFTDISKGINFSVSPGVNLGINIGSGSFSAGIGMSFSNTRQETLIQDFNGDGLADIIEIGENGELSIQFNTGIRFQQKISTGLSVNDDNNTLPLRFVPRIGPFKTWRTLEKTKFNSSAGQSAGGSFTFGFTIPIPPIKMVFTPSFNKSNGIGKTIRQFTDINADGFADYLYSTDEEVLHIRFSLLGRTNKLKEVTRPLGGSFTIDYEHNRPTPEHPGGKWVMKSVKISDGIEEDRVDDKGEKPTTDFDAMQTFEYNDGKEDKYEREFLGFGEVITMDMDFDGTTTYRKRIQGYDISNYYAAGNLLSETLTNADGSKKYTASKYEYLLQAKLPKGNDYTGNETPLSLKWYNGICFTALRYTSTCNFEGGADSTGFEKKYNYDQYGNVTQFWYSDRWGLKNNQYNYITEIEYETGKFIAKGLFSLPRKTEVIDPSGVLHRKTIASYSEKGSLKSISVLNDIKAGNELYATTRFEYAKDYGFLKKILFPENHKGDKLERTYEYDTKTYTHITKTNDQYTIPGSLPFEYSSSTEYDGIYFLPEKLKDKNNKNVFYEYDGYGRTKRIIGTFETINEELKNNPGYTILIGYNGSLNGNAKNNFAITTHYDTDNREAGIKTINIIDGFRRAVQIKKTAEVAGDGNKWIISGRINYDAFGRSRETYYPLTQNDNQLYQYNEGVDIIAGPTIVKYDIMDRPVETGLPSGTRTKLFSKTGRDVKKNALIETTVLYASDGNPNQVSEIHSNGSGLKLKEIHHKTPDQRNPITTTFYYDAINQLDSVRNTDQTTVIRNSYDKAGRKTRFYQVDAGSTQIEYDNLGNLTRKINTGNDTINYQYEYGLLTNITYLKIPVNNVKYEYGKSSNEEKDLNLAGRLVRQSDASGTQQFRYDRMGNISEITRTIIAPFDTTYTFQTKFSYDSWNRIQTISYPDEETVEYTYNTAGLLAAVTGKKINPEKSFEYIKEIRYDKFEQRTSILNGNNTKTFYRYEDDRRRLKGSQAKGIADTVFMNMCMIIQTISCN